MLTQSCQLQVHCVPPLSHGLGLAGPVSRVCPLHAAHAPCWLAGSSGCPASPVGVRPGWSGPGDPTALTPGFQRLTTTVLGTGSPVTAYGLLPPVFQPQTGPPADSPGSSAPACRSVMTADSHRTKKEAEAEPPPSPPRTTAHTAGRCPNGWCATVLAAAYRSHGPRRFSGNTPWGLWGSRVSKRSSGVQSALRSGTWPQLSPTLVCSPGAETRRVSTPHAPPAQRAGGGRPGVGSSAWPDSAAGGLDGGHPGRAAGGQQHLPNTRQLSNTGQPRPHRG